MPDRSMDLIRWRIPVGLFPSCMAVLVRVFRVLSQHCRICLCHVSVEDIVIFKHFHVSCVNSQIQNTLFLSLGDGIQGGPHLRDQNGDLISSFLPSHLSIIQLQISCQVMSHLMLPTFFLWLYGHAFARPANPHPTTHNGTPLTSQP